MKLNFLKRAISYNGSMEYKPLNDADLVANYQHYFVVDSFRQDIDGKKVLDAGCWTGPLEKAIKEQKIDVKLTGIDENKEALAVAKRNFPTFTFLECQLMARNQAFVKKYQNYFDTIIFLDVIEHLPKHQESKVLNFFHQILKKDGQLIVSTMSSHPLNFIDPAWFFGHRHYRLIDLKKMFESAGFEFSNIYRIGNLYWDIDLLNLYIHKHLLGKKYQTSEKMMQRIMRGLERTSMPTRYYLRLKKS